MSGTIHRTLPLLGVLLLCGSSYAAQPLAEAEEQAMKAAVASVAPSVVRIETVGGLERVGDVLIGTGSTTGLIVSEDGYIISSAFNFMQKPDSVLVTLPDGTRLAAKQVATDHDRKLVLLKISAAAPLPVPEAVPVSQIRVGQWAIALGRTFEGERPSMSVGIVSALGRIWNRAIQTDAKISPSNYGGPLVDISGRVFGVLAPLTPDAGGEAAGVDWYDSGIGFAVPLEQILTILPRLKMGDLHTGILGINLKSPDMFSQPAVLAACRVNSPAYKAGLKAGDEIISADGHPVTRGAQLKTVLGTHYAGDHVKLVARRGSEQIEADVQLAEKLEPYEFPFLGLLPERRLKTKAAEGFEDEKQPAEDKKPSAEGSKSDNAKPADEKPAADKQPVRDKGNDQDDQHLIVRYVYPAGPAAHAGILAGDVVKSIAGQHVTDYASAAEKLRDLAPEQTVAVEVTRGGADQRLDVVLGRLPDALPAGPLPPPHAAPVASTDAKPQTGTVTLKLPEFENSCMAFVPDSYDPSVPYGLVVWLGAPGKFEENQLADRWKPLCQAHDLILLAPKPADATRWQPTEGRFVRRMMDEVIKTYHIDPTRVVLHGHEAGGSLAYLVAFSNRDLVRAVAVVDAPLPALVEPPENNPVERLAFYTTRPSRAPFTALLDAGIAQLRERKYPLTVVEVGPQARYLTATELADLVRWIDSLDRL